MDTASEGQWEALNDTAGTKADQRSAGSRRQLLGGAAGGMVVAASGLLLPDWLAETEAREGALGGGKGGRRGNDHKGRHKRRTHGDKKDKQKDQDKPRGRGPFELRRVAILVHNYRSVPVQVKGWQGHYWGGYPTPNLNEDMVFIVPNGWDWSTIPARAADGSHSAKEFISTDNAFPRIVVVQIGTDRLVWGRNSNFTPPRAEIRTGAWNQDGWTGGETLGFADFWGLGSFSRDGIKVTRVADTEEHILFSVDL